MFVRWKKRRTFNSRLERSWLWRMRQREIEQKGTILSGYLVESYRKDGKPRQRVLKYLASIGEGHIATRSPGALIDFWTKANKALAELAGQGLTEDEIARVRKNLAAKVKLPSDEEGREFNAIMVAFFGENNEFLHVLELSGKADE